MGYFSLLTLSFKGTHVSCVLNGNAFLLITNLTPHNGNVWFYYNCLDQLDIEMMSVFRVVLFQLILASVTASQNRLYSVSLKDSCLL